MGLFFANSKPSSGLVFANASKPKEVQVPLTGKERALKSKKSPKKDVQKKHPSKT